MCAQVASLPRSLPVPVPCGELLSGSDGGATSTSAPSLSLQKCSSGGARALHRRTRAADSDGDVKKRHKRSKSSRSGADGAEKEREKEKSSRLGKERRPKKSSRKESPVEADGEAAVAPSPKKARSAKSPSSGKVKERAKRSHKGDDKKKRKKKESRGKRPAQGEEKREGGGGGDREEEEEEVMVLSYGSQMECSEEEDEDFVGDFEFEDEEDDRGFVCLEEKDIVMEQKRETEAVAELLSITVAQAASLLRHYRWKRDKLLAAYLEDADAVREIAGIRKPDGRRDANSGAGAAAMLGGGADDSCSICGDECEDEDRFAMECGHTFCLDCWGGYLSNKIAGGEAAALECPAYDCSSPLEEHVVRRLVPEDVFAKYLLFVTKSFVDSNEQVRWCPRAGCGNAVNIESIRHQTVTCACGHKFCFKCGEEAHGPALCEQVKEWNKKAQDESETNNWITANTQSCPKCDSAIEKNGGCNHMTCKQCGHEYCWMCRKDWKGHYDFYNCARFEKKTKKSTKSATKKSSKLDKDLQLALQKQEHRMRLERYLHYYDQYMRHERMAASNAKLREDIQRRLQEWKDNDGTMAEIRFVERALVVLHECRRALKWAYVRLFFYDDKNIRKHLFEFVKDDLDASTTQLHDLLHAAPFRKTDVVDITRLCETKLANLLTSAHDSDEL